MARYRWRGVTLKELRLGVTSAGDQTRPFSADERAGKVKFTQAYVAKRLHIHQGHIANIENGRQPASTFLLNSMSTLYDVPLKVVFEAYARSQVAKSPPRKRVT